MLMRLYLLMFVLSNLEKIYVYLNEMQMMLELVLVY